MWKFACVFLLLGLGALSVDAQTVQDYTLTLDYTYAHQLDAVNRGTCYQGPTMTISGDYNLTGGTADNRIVFRAPFTAVTSRLDQILDSACSTCLRKSEIKAASIRLTLSSPSTGWTNGLLELQTQGIADDAFQGATSFPPSFGCREEQDCGTPILDCAGPDLWVGTSNVWASASQPSYFQTSNMVNAAAGQVAFVDVTNLYQTGLQGDRRGFTVLKTVPASAAAVAEFHSVAATDASLRPKLELTLDACCFDAQCSTGYLGTTCACETPFGLFSGAGQDSFSKCTEAGATAVLDMQSVGTQAIVTAATNYTRPTIVLNDGSFVRYSNKMGFRIPASGPRGFIAWDTVQLNAGTLVEVYIDGTITTPELMTIAAYNKKTSTANLLGRIFHDGVLCEASFVPQEVFQPVTVAGKVFNYSVIVNFTISRCPKPGPTTGTTATPGSTGAAATTVSTTGLPVVPVPPEPEDSSSSDPIASLWWVWLILALVGLGVIVGGGYIIYKRAQA